MCITKAKPTSKMKGKEWSPTLTDYTNLRNVFCIPKKFF